MNHRLTVTAALATAAASTGLFLLIMGGDWFWGGLGAIIVVAVVGTLTRLRVLPPVVCLLAALGGLLLYLNLVYEAKLSFLHLFPTGASLAGLWRLGVQGLNDTQRYASPVPPLHGIVLLATAGIGLVAVLTDLIAVRLRRCALAGLPLLVLFSVPVASGAGKNTAGDAVVFCLGMAGYLALLSADGRERLRLWAGWSRPGPRPRTSPPRSWAAARAPGPWPPRGGASAWPPSPWPCSSRCWCPACRRTKSFPAITTDPGSALDRVLAGQA